MDKIIKIVTALFIVVVLGGAFFLIFPQINSSQIAQSGNERFSSDGTVMVYFFYGEECPACHAITPFIQSLKQKYADVDFQPLEIWHSQGNYNLYITLNSKAGIKNPAVPEVIIGDVVLVGTRDIPARLEGVILDQLKKKH